MNLKTAVGLQLECEPVERYKEITTPCGSS
jgi:hypothetical protein